MRAERCLTAWAVRADTVTAIQEPLAMDGGKDVPYTLDIVVRKCDVRVVEVRPVADGFCEFSPLLLVHKHAFLTLLNKSFNAILLDIAFARDAKLLLNAKLNWKTVCVPACFANYFVAGHRF